MDLKVITPRVSQAQVSDSQHLQTLAEIAALPDNWDEDDALAPHPKAVANAKAMIIELAYRGQEIYHMAPGPWGEIMLDLRNGEKSIEFLFYPEKSKFVSIAPTEKPTQGELIWEELTAHLNWLKR